MLSLINLSTRYYNLIATHPEQKASWNIPLTSHLAAKAEIPGMSLPCAACGNSGVALEDIFKGHNDFVPACVPLTDPRVSYKNSVCQLFSLWWNLGGKDNGFWNQWALWPTELTFSSSWMRTGVQPVGPLICHQWVHVKHVKLSHRDMIILHIYGVPYDISIYIFIV